MKLSLVLFFFSISMNVYSGDVIGGGLGSKAISKLDSRGSKAIVRELSKKIKSQTKFCNSKNICIDISKLDYLVDKEGSLIEVLKK